MRVLRIETNGNGYDFSPEPQPLPGPVIPFVDQPAPISATGIAPAPIGAISQPGPTAFVPPFVEPATPFNPPVVPTNPPISSIGFAPKPIGDANPIHIESFAPTKPAVLLNPDIPVSAQTGQAPEVIVPPDLPITPKNVIPFIMQEPQSAADSAGKPKAQEVNTTVPRINGMLIGIAVTVILGLIGLIAIRRFI